MSVYFWDETLGKVTRNTNPNLQPFAYAGGMLDIDGRVVHFGAREYDPRTGRWLQPDPIGARGGQNRYAYVDGDPVNMIDLSGLGGCFVNYPNYPITIPGTNWKTTLTPGHAGVLGYNNTSGVTRYYEYGRYDSDFGNVRRQTVSNMTIGKDGLPTPASLKAMQDELSRVAGEGTRADIKCDKNIDEKDIYRYSEDLKRNPNRPPYSWKPWQSNTCRDFADKALDAGRP